MWRRQTKCKYLLKKMILTFSLRVYMPVQIFSSTNLKLLRDYVLSPLYLFVMNDSRTSVKFQLLDSVILDDQKCHLAQSEVK